MGKWVGLIRATEVEPHEIRGGDWKRLL